MVQIEAGEGHARDPLPTLAERHEWEDIEQVLGAVGELQHPNPLRRILGKIARIGFNR